MNAVIASAFDAPWLMPVAGITFVLGVAWAAAWSGRHPDRIMRALDAISRRTGVQGWAGPTIIVGLAGLLLAFVGFYWDVAWHIDLGRDSQLFTPPHLMILAGLAAIPLASVVAILAATATRTPARIVLGRFRVPWSAAALAVIGGGALLGFPLDDLWHRAYGIDVTMWSPTHLMMIGGAAITPLALWLAVAESGTDARSARRAGVALGGAMLAGLSAFQGEFDFGVPQFQLLYHPVLVLAAAAIVLTALRAALGRGAAIKAALGFIALRLLIVVVLASAGRTIAHFPTYLVPALVVELAAMLPRRVRLVAGIAGLSTLGLAGEWAWSHVWMPHPWTTSMVAPALALGALAAFGGAIIGGRLAMPFEGPRPSVPVRAPAVVLALVALGIAVALPIPRHASPVVGSVRLIGAGSSAVDVEVRVADPGGIARARWFEALSWQGGGRTIAPLHRSGENVYRTEHPIPIGGRAKAMVRLQIGDALGAIPIRLPADPEVTAPAVDAVDRTARFERDSRWLMRESRTGAPTTARAVFGLASAVVLAWLVALAFAVSAPTRTRPFAPLGT